MKFMVYLQSFVRLRTSKGNLLLALFCYFSSHHLLITGFYVFKGFIARLCCYWIPNKSSQIYCNFLFEALVVGSFEFGAFWEVHGCSI